ncbi:MAG: hypothetical protein JNM43_20115 [Planctomycetaceae bacterium]|nr:hypothetical protein [Planctomycetaceae bacterium]
MKQNFDRLDRKGPTPVQNLRTTILVFVAGFAAVHSAHPLQGQQQGPPAFDSVEVKGDRSVLFRIWAPNASKVNLVSSDMPGSNPFGPGIELSKHADGVWETTTAPVAAGSYRYAFDVDGLTVTDPKNGATSESNSNTWSLFSVPGSSVSDLQEVPQGAISIWTYRSKSLGRSRRVHVYTPPGYEGSSGTYPVLYLLHGAMDSDASWSTVGRAGTVLDNLIAAGKAKPMIVVMPMGHTGPFTFGPGGNNFQEQMSLFERDFAEDLRPAVEQRYRITSGRENRAIAGLSMGGAQTLNIAIRNLSDYGYIGVFSSGVFGIEGTGFGANNTSPTWQEQHSAALQDKEVRQGLKLVWFATGKDDFLLSTSRATVDMLKKHGFPVIFEETEGGHTWHNWRELYLPAFASRLFQ